MSTANWYFLKVDNKVTKVTYTYDNKGANEEWKSIPANQFLSVKEIAEHQLTTMHKDDKVFISAQTKKELNLLHFSYGMWLRNAYGLWHPNNPFVVKNDLGDGHPDGLSMLVIEEIHKRLTTSVPTESDAFQDAMSIVQEKK